MLLHRAGLGVMTMSRTLVLSAAAMCSIVLGPSVFAACQLPSGATSGSCSYSGTGSALTITGSGTGSHSFEGVATGTNGRGFYGEAKGTGGYGGLFQSNAPTGNANNSAIYGSNIGGSTTAKGNYGHAGNFVINNAMNQSAAVAISTNGINAYGLSVVNSGTMDGSLLYGNPYDAGAVAGYFEINNPNLAIYEATGNVLGIPAAIYAVNSAGNSKTCCTEAGSAGLFVNTNKYNNDATVSVYNLADHGDGVFAKLTGGGGDGSAIDGWDATTTGGTAVSGSSNVGYAAFFEELSGNFGICSFNGGAGWNCSSDRNLKEDFRAVDMKDMLHRLAAMPVSNYRFKYQPDRSVRWLGPTAQDFKAAFGLGDKDDTRINEANALGVALAAIKGLYQELQDRAGKLADANRKAVAQGAQIAELRASHDALTRQLAEQRTALAELKATVARLVQNANSLKQARLAQ